MASQYQLTNAYFGPQRGLEVDTSQGGLRLQVSSGIGLVWTLNAPSATTTTTTSICTETVDGSRLCLDVFGDARTVPHFSAAADVTGQQWTLVPQPGGSYYKLSNGFTGACWYLDTYSVTQKAFMSDGNFTGQFWLLNAAAQPSKASSVAAAAPTISSSSPSSSPQTPPPSQSKNAGPSPGPASTTPPSSVSDPALPGASSKDGGGDGSQGGYSLSDKIALGVGIGFGIPTVVIAIITLWVMCIRG